MTKPSNETGLPELPEGQFWRVGYEGTQRDPKSRAFVVVALMQRGGWFGPKVVESTKADIMRGFFGGRGYRAPTEVDEIPGVILKCAEDILSIIGKRKKAEEEKAEAILEAAEAARLMDGFTGDYPPKRLVTKAIEEKITRKSDWEHQPWKSRDYQGREYPYKSSDERYADAGKRQKGGKS